MHHTKTSRNIFFCPLCRSERVQRVAARMSWRNHIQLFMLTTLTTILLSPFIGWRGIGAYFIYWAMFETTRRLIFKKDMPCPHCGFDATWYKRDVKMARRKVQEFWAQREAEKLAKTPLTP